MRTLIEIVASVLSSGVGVALLVGFTVRHRVRKSNRLVAGRSSAAPLTWVFSPRRAPMLHRRLRACCQIAVQVTAVTTGHQAPARRSRPWRRAVVGVPGPFERIASEMIAQAVDLDAQLVIADQRVGVWRRRALSGLAGEVRRLELASHRLVSLHRIWQSQLGEVPPEPGFAVGAQLDALEAALGGPGQP
jgi:hypothetical protein